MPQRFTCQSVALALQDALFSLLLLACIRKKRNSEAINPYLHGFYQKKATAKPKMVALGAVMHKVCNYIFAVLRDETEFVIRSPEEHRLAYKSTATLAA